MFRVPLVTPKRTVKDHTDDRVVFSRFDLLAAVAFLQVGPLMRENVKIRSVSM